MKLLDVLAGDWALSENYLNPIIDFYRAHIASEKVDWKAIEAKAGEPLSKTSIATTSDDGRTAIVPLTGILQPTQTFFSRFFGGTGLDQFTHDIKAAADNPRIEKIIIECSSPGGSVMGTETAAAEVMAARDKKEIVVVADLIGSAATWIGAQAHKIYLSEKTAIAGSIGIYMAHVSFEEAEKRMGLKVTLLTAGSEKVIGNPHNDLTDKDKEILLAQINKIYGIFKSAVSLGRGVDLEKVEAMAGGRVFIGQDAIDVGLVDGFSTVNQQILTPKNKQIIFPTKAKMNLDELKANHPELYNQIMSDGLKQGKTAGLSEGQQKENARVKAINDLAAGMPGYEDIISAAIADGVSQAGDVSLKIVDAMKAERTAASAVLKSDAKIIVHQASAQAETQAPEPVNPKKIQAAAQMQIEASSGDGKLTDEEIQAAWNQSDKKFVGGFNNFKALHKNKWRLIEPTGRPRV